MGAIFLGMKDVIDKGKAMWTKRIVTIVGGVNLLEEIQRCLTIHELPLDHFWLNLRPVDYGGKFWIHPKWNQQQDFQNVHVPINISFQQ